MLRERGFTGSPRTVRTYVAAVRPEPKPEAFLRLETLPGEQTQVDWAHVGRMPVDSGERSLWAFMIVLSYSRAVGRARPLGRRARALADPRREEADAAGTQADGKAVAEQGASWLPMLQLGLRRPAVNRRGPG